MWTRSASFEGCLSSRFLSHEVKNPNPHTKNPKPFFFRTLNPNPHSRNPKA